MNNPRYAVFRGGSMLLGRRSRQYVYEVCDTHRAQTGYGGVVVFRGTAQECRRECERRNVEWSKQRAVQP
jgi:hypothetical protein